MSSKWLQRGLALSAIALGGVGFWWFHYQSGVEWNVTSVQQFVADLGPLGPVILIGMMAMRPFLALPSVAILVAGGFLFGPAIGPLYGTLGGTLGALIALGIARSLGRDAVQRRLGSRLQTLDEYLARRGPTWLGAYTALPFSVLSPVYFTAGVTRMPALPFGIAIGLGFLPRAGFYTFLGDILSEPSTGKIVLACLLVAVMGIGIWLGRAYLFPSETEGPTA